MPRARYEQVDVEATPWYHVVIPSNMVALFSPRVHPGRHTAANPGSDQGSPLKHRALMAIFATNSALDAPYPQKTAR